MKPTHVSVLRSCVMFTLWTVLSISQPLHAQHIMNDINNIHAQADYIVITPTAYVSIMQEFATHRSMYSHLNVIIVTTDAIYQTFGQGTSPDSAIRSFVTYALTSWSNPKPQYFLLAGNVNTVPSHLEGPLYEGLEDSVLVDQWLVEGPNATGNRKPAAAIGRLPGWDTTEMSILVAKTVQYDKSDGAGWRNRSLCVADNDSTVGPLFENAAQELQMRFAPRWMDTVTVHVRPSSPLYKTREQFRTVWKTGAAITTFMGFVGRTAFSNERYFTAADIDSLPIASPLSMIRLLGGQRFDRHDTVCLATAFLLAQDKGAICTLAPPGAAWFSNVQDFMERVAGGLVSNPSVAIGKIIENAKQEDQDFQGSSRETLLGDPALVIKNPLLADVDHGQKIPKVFALHQNFPNPFNPTTQITFDLPANGPVTLKVYNLLGQEVGTLLNSSLRAGTHTYTLNADDLHLSTGVYLYRLTAGNVVETRRMILLK